MNKAATSLATVFLAGIFLLGLFGVIASLDDGRAGRRLRARYFF